MTGFPATDSGETHSFYQYNPSWMMMNAPAQRKGLLLLALLGWYPLLGCYALYRGDEYENRDYRICSEYFIDRIVLLPTFEARLSYRDADNAYLGAAGSYTKEDLFLIQNLKLKKALFKPVSFLFNFEMDQDFDNPYEHHFLALSTPLIESWSAELLAEPLARKEFSDLGAAVMRKQDRSMIRTEFILPNFVFEEKNDMEGTFVQRPYTLRMNAYYPIIAPVEVFAALDWDFPSETDYVKPGFDFTFKSCKPGAGIIWHVQTNQMLWAEFSGETTDKKRDSDDHSDSHDFTTDRRFFSGRLEYVIRSTTGNRCSTGCQYVYLDEDNLYPNDNEETYDLDHLSRILYATVGVPLKGGLRVNTGVYVDFTHHVENYYQSEEGLKDSSGFEGKIPLSIEWTGEDYSIGAGAAVQVDKLAFGGGFAGIHVIF